MTDALYCSDPRHAAELASRLLSESNFEELSRYYDLSGTDIDRAELRSGRFFVRTQRPPAAHPGGFWRYKEPMAPGFRYASHTVDEQGIAHVRVTISIDQGDGMTQHGESVFMMRQHAEGWQFIPQSSRAVQPPPVTRQ